MGRTSRWQATSVAAVISGAAVVITGCSAESAMTSVASESSDLAAGQFQVAPVPADEHAVVKVTARQRGYLNALAAAGVRPSSELVALSIGSAVCHARAAKHDEQDVWDYVLPMVRNDVRASRLRAANSEAVPAPAAVNAATADYIRIATEQLC